MRALGGYDIDYHKQELIHSNCVEKRYLLKVNSQKTLVFKESNTPKLCSL